MKFDIQVFPFAVFFQQYSWYPTRARGLTLLSAPIASSSCSGDRPHSKFLMAETESVTAATLVTDCSNSGEKKKMKA